MKGRPGKFDVLVVGAGPAGISAAMWCAELGLSVVVFEQRPEAGGQLRHIYNPITNYLGSAARDGAEMCDKFLQTFGRYNVPIVLNACVEKIDVERVSLECRGEECYGGRYIITATGVGRRKLGVPGEGRFEGKGILRSGARDRATVAGKVVAIVGGGDAALENALLLSEFASRVYLIHRGSRFTARPEFVEGAAANPKIEFIFESTVASIDGGACVESIALRRTGVAKATLLEVDFVLVRIGVVPNTTLLNNKVDLDPSGYVLVDQVGRTSAVRVYAVGDSACPASPTIATAAGMGATAAKHIWLLLNA